MRSATILFALVLFVNTFCHGQTGSIDPTVEQLTGIRTFTAPAIELVEEKVVDLRPWLPEVGHQRMNDCTAWAVGYAAKTFLEARDQGWRPDRASRIFSPRFLYNQINGGKDGGANFIKAIKLMAAKGAATMATCEYQAGEFKGQPSNRAFEEAKAFPVHEPVLMWNRKGIRRALQRRQVVIFGAHVSPIFLSGRFKVYTPALFVRDCQDRKPGQRHGKHAMVIVGYDDSRSAFLVLNSWGKSWGQRGYCWIQYELFDNIEIKSDDSTFCNWSCYIEDVQEKIVYDKQGLPRPAALDVNSLTPTGYSDIIRYDVAQKKYVYSFTAKLSGQSAALSKVKKVTWVWMDENGKKKDYTSVAADERFSFHAGTTQNPLNLKVNMLLDDGTIQSTKAEIIGPNPKSDFRQAKIYFDHHYYGPGAKGKPNFWWEAHIDCPLEQTQDIVKVVWNVGKNMNFREPVQINDGFNGPPATEHAVGMCQKSTPITATIHYSDGGIKSVTSTLRITDEANENWEIDVAKHKLGEDLWGRTRYSFSLLIDLPNRQLYDIDSVTYKLDPWASRNPKWSNRSSENFQVHGTSSRDFRVTAEIKLAGKDNKVKYIEKWVTLGPETKYPSKERIEVLSWDRYNGRINGEPDYTVYFMLAGDRQELSKIEEVKWQQPNLGGSGSYEVLGRMQPDDLTLVWNRRAKDRTTLHGTLVFEDGHKQEFQAMHTVKSQPNDTIGFNVAMPRKRELYLDMEHRDLQEFTIRPIGPDHDVITLSGVDWTHTLRGIRELSSHQARRYGLSKAWALTSAITEPFKIECLQYNVDGYEELVEASMGNSILGDLRPDIQLRIKEKFWGYEDGKPLWQIELQIAKDNRRVPSPVAAVTYAIQGIDGFKSEPLECKGPRGLFSCRISKPAWVTASVRFVDGTNRMLKSFARASAKRHATPIFLRDIFDSRDERYPQKRMLIIDSWVREQFNIEKVTWDCERDYFDKTFDSKNGYPRVIEYTRIPDSKEKIAIKVFMKDKTTYAWNLDFNIPPGEINWDMTVKYWGLGLWQVDAQAAGDWFYIADLYKKFSAAWSQGKMSFQEVGSWPLGRKRALVKSGTYAGMQGRIGDGKYLSNKTVEIDSKIHATPETLSLKVELSPFKHEEATIPEYIMRLEGPEKLMTQVTQVVYTYKDSRQRNATVTRRWGEFYAGFENRMLSILKPAVTAQVTLADGKRIELSGPR